MFSAIRRTELRSLHDISLHDRVKDGQNVDELSLHDMGKYGSGLILSPRYRIIGAAILNASIENEISICIRHLAFSCSSQGTNRKTLHVNVA